MRIRSTLLVAAASASMASAAYARGPMVYERFGNIVYENIQGISCALSSGSGFGEPVLSPDGRTAAFIHIDGPGDDAQSGPPETLWVADTATCKSHRLISSRVDEDDPRHSFTGFSHPTFSLSGGFIYVTAAMAPVSPAVHQINIVTGQERFVIDGAVNGVIRAGAYRGYLLVGRHAYYAPPRTGSYNAVFVVRPDGQVMMVVPGSQAGEAQIDATPQDWPAALKSRVGVTRRTGVDPLFASEAADNESCRGGEGDTPATQTACRRRDAEDVQLQQRGWCYGEGAADGAHSVWAKCR